MKTKMSIKNKISKSVKIIFIFLLILNLDCKKKNEISHEYAVLFATGDVRSGEKEVHNGEIISTDKPLKLGNQSFADIQLIHSESIIVMRIGSNSEVIWKSEFQNGKEIITPKIIKGKVLFLINKLSDNTGFAVLSPAMKTKVTGTKFYIDIAETGKATLMVIEGEVKVKPGYIELDGLPEEKIKEVEMMSSYLYSDSEESNWREMPKEKVKQIEDWEYITKVLGAQFIELKPDYINKVEKLFDDVLKGKEISKEELRLLKEKDHTRIEKISNPPYSKILNSLNVEILELDPLLPMPGKNPEKIKEAVLKRLEKMEKVYLRRISTVFEKDLTLVTTLDGRKFFCVVLFENMDYLHYLTKDGSGKIPVKELYEINFHVKEDGFYPAQKP